MKGLHGWMRLLEDNEAAMLSTLLNELDRVTGSDDSSGEQLAKIIMKDAHLTANILRVANSVTFNPNNVPVTTISRAVINIGFTHIRSLCLSIKVLEAVVKERSSPLLMCTLARALHASSQAKALCPKLKPTQQEEVFVACLLSHLAELLVLGFPEAEVKMLSDEVVAHSTCQEKDRAAEKYLGVSITRLSKTLMKQWRIQGLILDVVNCILPEDASHAVKAVQLGNEISRTALLGWNSPEFIEALNRIAEFQQLAPEDIKKSIMQTADLTAETITSFGKKILVDYIPTSKRVAKSLPTKEETLTSAIAADPAFLNQVFTQLEQMIKSDFNLNSIFKVVLSGLNKGVGLERITIAIFDKPNSKFVAKNLAGLGTENWKDSFILKYEKNRAGFLYQLFERKQIVWVGGEQFRELSNYVGSEFLAITGQKQFFIAPLQVESKMIGLLYADLGYSSQALTVNHFDGFHKLTQYVNEALLELANKV